MKFIKRIPRRYTELWPHKLSLKEHEELLGYRPAYYEWDTNSTVFALWYIAWLVKLYWWWRLHRWCIEYVLCRHGILIVDPGGHLYTRKMNWDWRWYDKSTWHHQA